VNTSVTDVGLEHLKGLRNLRFLDLCGTKVTGNGLASLSYLNLQYTEVTDEALENLSQWSGLRDLRLEESRVTKEGVKQLRAKLPLCRIAY
jgi:hypothetical protein